MSYFRRPMGDGHVTDPSQVDPTVSTIVGTVPPTLVDCAQLPADSPWRQPGQVCAPKTSVIDDLTNFFTLSPSSSTASTSGTGSAIPPIAWVGAAAVAAYYLFGKKGRR